MDFLIHPTTVINRQGESVPIDILKIRRVIEQACEGLPVDPLELELDSQIHFVDGMTTSHIQDILIRVANEKTSMEQPAWTYVAARLLLHDLYQDMGRHRPRYYQDFADLVAALTREGYYDPAVLEGYTPAELEYLGSQIRPERDLLFTYAGLKHLSDRYGIRDAKGVLRELPQEIFMGVSAYLALAELPTVRVQWALKFYEVLSQLFITLATPTLAQARRPQGQLSSCFIDTPGDSIAGIFDGLTTFAHISQNGGGMGVYLGHLRALGSTIRKVPGVGSGVIPWVRLYNDTAVSVNQLGQRAGAVSLWLDVWHRDILDFLDLKTNNGDDRRKAHDVFPGVCIPDRFYEAVETDGPWYLFDPHEIEQTMGWRLEDAWGEEWNRRYDACLANPQLSRTEIPALELMTLMLKSLYETGGPFIFHRDTVNRLNPNKHAGMIYSSNLCTEITQNQSTTERTTYALEGDELVQRSDPGDLVVCNLSSINLGRTNTRELLGEVIPIQVRLLDNVITLNHLPVPQATRTNQRYRAIGIGISGYHQHLVQKGIPWESEEHLEYMDALFEHINYTAIRASAGLAQERGAYPLFAGSDWQTGEYFRVRGYTSAAWQALAADIRDGGIRHGYLMAIAPTGSTSVIAGSTAGIDPIFRPVFTEEKKGFIIRQIAPDLTADNLHLYQEAHHIDQMWSLRAAAVRQRHLDQSQSLNLYATPDLDADQFLQLYYQAWRLGIKTVYYFRNYTPEDIVEPAAPVCESCEA